MKIRIIAVTFGHTVELEVFIGSLLLQTCPDWTCEIWHDGPAPQIVKDIMGRYADDKRIVLKCTDKRNGVWGHVSRRIALEQMTGDLENDFVLITNADNVYTPVFVEDTLAEVKKHPNAGVVFTDTLHSHLRYGYHSSKLKEGFLDMGCAIVRLGIAKSIGFRWETFSADGRFLEECGLETQKRGMINIHIPRGLFVHN